MRPIKVEFQAFGPYAGYEMVDFDAIAKKGLFLICGKTGIGKTMILDAMTFALYGKSSGHSRDDFEAMRCTNADFDITTFVKLELENNGEYYIFERRLERKRKNLSPSYNLMKKDDDGLWRSLLENAKEKDLNRKAEEIIGLEYEQFSQVIVLPQGKFEKLLTSNSDEKEKILTSIFGEDKWQEIAEYLYAEVVERKDSLKEKKDRIINSLKEENCDSIMQLEELIEQKDMKLKEMESSYKAAGYETKKKELQDLLSIAKRFEDLEKAKSRVTELEDEEDKYASMEKTASDALRANKVKELLKEKDNAEKELVKRQQAEKDTIEETEKKKEEASVISMKLKAFNEKGPEIEEKKKLKLQYEGKRADYEGLNDASKLVKDAKNEEKKAEQAEKEAKAKLDIFAPKITKLQQDYFNLGEEHKILLEHYLAGITGELAAGLTEGKPCPVCGSTSHPHKAVKADESMTREMVDEKKDAADEKYSELQDALRQQLDAKSAYDEKRSLTEKSRAQVTLSEAKLEGIKKNLVKDIDSLKELNDAILKLDNEIEEFAAKKAELENNEKAIREACAEAGARIESAKKEAIFSSEKLNKALMALEKGLKECGFDTEEQAKALMMDDEKINGIRTEIAEHKASVKAADESFKSLQEELKGKINPNKDECDEKLKIISEAENSYAKDKGILEAETGRLKQKKEKLDAEGDGIEEKIHEAEEDFAFAKKLRGDSGTGLQRYVLGIMFSSVVKAANQMLEMVHGGRYSLFRSDDKAQGTNKRGLELKVFDKNSEEHEGRFVSTLSGGEKFLCSLALSIGMSTVAQKSGIKIEALFIDEGFGSLDEDSIGDAMDILDSIQEANGLVGIISHVQILQDRIPNKLRVEQLEKGSHIIQTIG